MFYENYLGERDATFTLNFSRRAMILAQFYNFLRFGARATRRRDDASNARAVAAGIEGPGFELVGDPGAQQLRLVAFQLAEKHGFDEFDIAWQLAPSAAGWSPRTRSPRTPGT